MKCSWTFVLIISVLRVTSIYGELLTLTGWFVGSAVFGGGYYKWQTVKENTICRFTECCTPDYVPYDIKKLEKSLANRLFGQPLASELVNILNAHKQAFGNKHGNRKALVISLHGWSGVGKNYVTNMVTEALFKKGLNSNYVKFFMGLKDLSCNELEKNKEHLVNRVKEVVKSCPRALIILDEIHEMCPSVLDMLKPMLDYHHEVDGIDYRDAVFIFISNIGGDEIAEHLLELYNAGYKRADVKFHHFEPVIRRISYYSGGFEKSSIIAQHLIDHYIPFLPLEQQHVEMCALAEFEANGVTPTKEMLADALSVITYGPTEDQPIFANNACKRFANHIPYVIEKHRTKTVTFLKARKKEL